MIALLSLLLLGTGCERGHAPEGHDAHDEDHHEDEAAPEGHGHHAEEGAEGAEIELSEDLRRDLRVSFATARQTAGGEQVSLLGEVRPHEDASGEVSAPVAARVLRALVGTGQAVEKGQPTAELESAELGRARADLLAARARSAAAQAALARKRALSGVASTAEIELAEADARAAEAEVAAVAAALAAYGVGTELGEQSPGGRFTLRAPLAGTVVSREFSAGQVVDAEEVLLRVVDLGRLQVEVHAFERDAARLAVGQHADVELSAIPGARYPATVARVGDEVEVESRTIPVRLDLEGAARLRPGMAATARIALASVGEQGVAVPAAALQRLSGGWVVFVPKGDHGFEVRPVGRGRDLGGDVEVLSGLAPGERVVLDGAFLLKAEAEKRSGGGGGHHDH